MDLGSARACPSCGHANRTGAKFCNECAAPLRQSCSSCGAELHPSAKFCDESSAVARFSSKIFGFGGATWMGTVLCLPFRGFCRSGSTISTGLFLGLDKRRVEEFSFALAVLLTPPVIAKEGYRLLKAHAGQSMPRVSLISPGRA